MRKRTLIRKLIATFNNLQFVVQEKEKYDCHASTFILGIKVGRALQGSQERPHIQVWEEIAETKRDLDLFSKFLFEQGVKEGLQIHNCKDLFKAIFKHHVWYYVWAWEEEWKEKYEERGAWQTAILLREALTEWFVATEYYLPPIERAPYEKLTAEEREELAFEVLMEHFIPEWDEDQPNDEG